MYFISGVTPRELHVAILGYLIAQITVWTLQQKMFDWITARTEICIYFGQNPRDAYTLCTKSTTSLR